MELDNNTEWYDVNGNLDVNGCYDAGGHYYLEREAYLLDAYYERQQDILVNNL